MSNAEPSIVLGDLSAGQDAVLGHILETSVNICLPVC